MKIERSKYLEKLISKKENGLVKVITGIRRCGKSYLLFNIYKEYLNSIGIADSQIICLALDDDENIRYRNPLELGKYVRAQTRDKNKTYYVFLDEIQKVATIKNPYLQGTEYLQGAELEDVELKNARPKKTEPVSGKNTALNNKKTDDTISFVDVVLGLMKQPNLDLYITGSNSKMLSSDILTEFRGREDEIRVSPLSFAEFHDAFAASGHNTHDAWQEYFTYGGMPMVFAKKNHEEKARYLQTLFDTIYIADIMERHKLMHEKSTLDDLLNIVSSSIGSLTNATKIAKTFKSERHVNISPQTISRYLDLFCDAFLLEKAQRYDVKGRKYIGSPLKYYFSDVGLRNARLNFRQQEENHIMENIIYNELCGRDFNVDVGVIEHFYKNEQQKSQRAHLEIDFVANKGNQRFYIQSALNIDSEHKRDQETRPLRRVADSFKKIVVVKDNIIPWHDEDGILYIGIEKFLLDEHAMSM